MHKANKNGEHEARRFYIVEEIFKTITLAQ
jgi:hypothetical protein